MKVYVLTEHLQKRLLLLSHGVSTRAQLPILLHLLLETREGRLNLSATDLEIGIETSITASVEEDGAIAVPARMFIELINSLPAGKLVLEVKGNQLEVVGRNTRSKLA